MGQTKCSAWRADKQGWVKFCVSERRSAQARIVAARDYFRVDTRTSDASRWRSAMTFGPVERRSALPEAKRWAADTLRYLVGPAYCPRPGR